MYNVVYGSAGEGEVMYGTIKVRKWGSSIGIVIPKFVAQQMKIQVGSKLKLTYRENTMELSTGPTDKERLDRYLTKVLLENQRMIDEYEQASDIIRQ